MTQPSRIRARNPVACAPLLRKGGPHQKSKSAKRFKHKMSTRREVADATRWRFLPLCFM